MSSTLHCFFGSYSSFWFATVPALFAADVLVNINYRLDVWAGQPRQTCRRVHAERCERDVSHVRYTSTPHLHHQQWCVDNNIHHGHTKQLSWASFFSHVSYQPIRSSLAKSPLMMPRSYAPGWIVQFFKNDLFTTSTAHGFAYLQFFMMGWHSWIYGGKNSKLILQKNVFCNINLFSRPPWKPPSSLGVIVKLFSLPSLGSHLWVKTLTLHCRVGRWRQSKSLPLLRASSWIWWLSMCFLGTGLTRYCSF